MTYLKSLKLYQEIQAEFDLGIRNNGSYYIASNADELQLIEELYDINIQTPTAWVFGSEGSGIRAEVLALCGNAVTIPMALTSESLNVAAAAAICIFESVRRVLSSPGD